jgi:hypothetical protein
LHWSAPEPQAPLASGVRADSGIAAPRFCCNRPQGCTAVHKLRDNLRIFHELAGPVFPPRELRANYLVQVRQLRRQFVCVAV